MKTPTPAEVLADPATRDWLKNALRAALDRDPVDALADAELLARVLRARWIAMQEGELAGEPNEPKSAPAVFEKRENMGASPLAIEYAEIIVKELPLLGTLDTQDKIIVAMLIDAAIRKSGAPELLASCRALLPLADRLNALIYTNRPPEGAHWSTDWKEQVDSRKAIAKAEGRAE